MPRLGANGRRYSNAVVRTLVALSGMLAIAGWVGKNENAAVPEEAAALAVLMADAPLPSWMQPETPFPYPERYCPSSFPDIGPLPEVPFPEEQSVSPPPEMAGSGGMGGAAAGSGGSSGAPPVGDSAGPEADGGVDGSDGSDAADDELCVSSPMSFWRFDDCDGSETQLANEAIQGYPAYRRVAVTCAPGKDGQAVPLSAEGDIVYAPDHPFFAFDRGATVAAWVKPDEVDGVATLFRKRDGDSSLLALIINDKKFQFIVELASGKLVTVSAPAQASVWTHVAGTYDGTQLRLYTNGVEVSRTEASGTIANGAGPLLIGNDFKERRLHGLLDNVWFNTLAAPAPLIMALMCVHHAPTLAVSPEVSPAVRAGTNLRIELSITNNDSSSCPPMSFYGDLAFPETFNANQHHAASPRLASGETATLSFDIASGEGSAAGAYPLDFLGIPVGENFRQSTGVQAQYIVAEPTGCFVRSGRELTIRDVSVVDDPLRTAFDGPSSNPRTGAWTFGRMMERLSPTEADAPDVTLAMFRSFTTPQVVNSFTIEARPHVDRTVLQPWPRTPDGKLDLARAPLRLLAIVNRLDLKNLDEGKGGAAQFVYGVLDEHGDALEFTVRLEYLLPAANEAEFREWANAFHGLAALSFPSEAYNAALQAITDRFTARNAVPSRPNGSALIDVRTNEVAQALTSQLREFHISRATGLLQPARVLLTPDASFNFTETLARFINANEASILTETHDVPMTFEDAPFQAGAVFASVGYWSADGINNPEARQRFSLHTCDGCHGEETLTGFFHISPRQTGEQSALSNFLLGETIADPVAWHPRRFAELARRRALLEDVVCNP